MTELRKKAAEFFRGLQETICKEIEQCDGENRFSTDIWQRDDAGGGHGGGGVSRILQDGAVFEQAGVNFSEVSGTLPSDMSERLTLKAEPSPFYATGTSIVVHPESPLIPTTHANVRYLEVGPYAWFGGGMDLTPYYLFEEDAVHFHQVNKATCDRFDKDFYPRFKKNCDSYFYLPHRGEGRGIGGIFFDYMGKDDPEKLDSTFDFVKAVGESFVDAYLPVVRRRKDGEYTEVEKEFQLIRRGRYVEFNLVYDRGTLFGLRTGGRTQSILMSLPKKVHWAYDEEKYYTPGSAEARLLEVLRHPREWV